MPQYITTQPPDHTAYAACTVALHRVWSKTRLDFGVPPLGPRASPCLKRKRGGLVVAEGCRREDCKQRGHGRLVMGVIEMMGAVARTRGCARRRGESGGSKCCVVRWRRRSSRCARAWRRPGCRTRALRRPASQKSFLWIHGLDGTGASYSPEDCVATGTPDVPGRWQRSCCASECRLHA